MQKKNLLVLCTGNSCRSQMAEAYFRLYHGDRFDVYSAGIEKHGLNPFAMGILLEDGIDLSKHASKTIEELPKIDFDLIITVCDHANEVCPIFSGNGQRIHHNFKDPSKAEGTAQRLIAAFRKTREEIKTFAKDFTV
ncbi:MAG: arsenate reductase ArsC [Flavobacteriales bacterium]|nr:arsenate reductase ArsC [Flavobacteriales bacterium]